MYLEDTNENQLEKMATDSERCCELLLTADVDVIAYGCTTGSFVKGPEFDKEIESRITKITGVPTVATAAAIKRAFDALQLEKIAIATPYVNRLNKRETEFLQSAGYSVVDMSGLGIEPNTEIGAQKPEHVYRQAMKLDTTDADGVFISCTNYRTFEVIDQLEEDLGLPVVTSNQATLWNSLRAMGVKSSDLILGRLFEEQAL